MKLWVDDIRPKPDMYWYHAFNSAEAIKFLDTYRQMEKALDNYRPSFITDMSLDHDLGGDDTSRKIVLWCCENEYWPLRVYVHTQNPIGREWLEGMIDRYAPDGCLTVR